MLFEWLQQKRADSIPIYGPTVSYAQDAAKVVVPGFRVSNGWLYHFKKTYVTEIVYDESDDVEGNVHHWINTPLPGMNCGCEPRDIFNADEVPFSNSLTQHKTLTLRSETCAGGSKAKGWLTILPCIADVTEKLKLLIIGKFEKPMC
jgi:hypothetical protein